MCHDSKNCCRFLLWVWVCNAYEMDENKEHTNIELKNKRLVYLLVFLLLDEAVGSLNISCLYLPFHNARMFMETQLQQKRSPTFQNGLYMWIAKL